VHGNCLIVWTFWKHLNLFRIYKETWQIKLNSGVCSRISTLMWLSDEMYSLLHSNSLWNLWLMLMSKERYVTVFMYILGKAARDLMYTVKCIHFRLQQVCEFCGYIILWSVSISGYSRSASFVVTSSYEVYPFPVTAGLRVLWLHHPMKCIHFRLQQVCGFCGYIILWIVIISGYSRSAGFVANINL